MSFNPFIHIKRSAPKGVALKESSPKASAPSPKNETGDKRKVAFVFAGGGSRGAVQVGMAKRLYEQGIYPDIVTGVSIGSINGYFVAQDKIDQLENMWRTIKGNDDVYRQRWFATPLMYAGLQWGYPSLYRPGPMTKKIGKDIQRRKRRDFKAEFRFGAVDLLSGKYVSINQNHALLERFLVASMSVPISFPSVKIKPREDAELAGLYVDGCVRNITPIAEAVRMGATEIHLLLTSSSEIPSCNRSYRKWSHVVDRTIEVAMHELFVRDIEQMLMHNMINQMSGNEQGCIKLNVYDTEGIELQTLLDFNPNSISANIEIGYELALRPKKNEELKDSYNTSIRAIPHGHHYVDWANS